MNRKKTEGANKLKAKLLEKKIQLLEKKLNPEEPEVDFFDKYINDPFNKYSTLILTVISILGGVWGVYFPIKEYLRDQQRSVQYDLNSQIISLVTDLNDSILANREKTIAILTYYERDAVPILVYELGRRKINDRTPIINALKTIVALRHSRNEDNWLANLFKEKGINQLILENLVDHAGNHFERGFVKPIEPMENRLNGILNYIHAIGDLGEGATAGKADAISLLRHEFLDLFVRDSLSQHRDSKLEYGMGEDDEIKNEIRLSLQKLERKKRIAK